MKENSIKNKLYHVIFEAETPAGKLFDIILLITIFISVTCVILESITNVNLKYGQILFQLEWIFTILFTIEYFIRIYIVNKPIKYIFSFMGLVDLLSIIPTYLIMIVDIHSFTVIRSIRLIRIFRIFHLSSYIMGGRRMMLALKQAFPKIIVFMLSVVILVTFLGTLMYIIEGPGGANTHGFEDIPNSIYWSIVTLTTVGYGTVVPFTSIGKILSSIIMLLGYGIIAVPTGIVSVAMVQNQSLSPTRTCSNCMEEGHEKSARFCKACGEKFDDN